MSPKQYPDTEESHNCLESLNSCKCIIFLLGLTIKYKIKSQQVLMYDIFRLQRPVHQMTKVVYILKLIY